MSNYVYGNPLLLGCWEYCQSWNAFGHLDSRVDCYKCLVHFTTRNIVPSYLYTE